MGATLQNTNVCNHKFLKVFERDKNDQEMRDPMNTSKCNRRECVSAGKQETNALYPEIMF